MGEFVFKRQCERCPAVEEVPVSLADIKKGVDPSKDKSRALKISMGGKETVSYGFLCTSCHEICTGYIENISRQLKKKSATRTKSEEDGVPVEIDVE